MEIINDISKTRKEYLLNVIDNFDTEVKTFDNIFGPITDINNYFVTQGHKNTLNKENDLSLSKMEHNMLILLNNYLVHTKKPKEEMHLKMTDIKMLAESEWAASYSNTTLLIDSLVNKNFLERYQLKGNRKNIYIRFTEKGTNLIDELRSAFLNTIDTNLSYMTEEEVKQFFSAYKTIFKLYRPLVAGIETKTNT